ncbi:unnamed protein product [Urochloa humidicola]
MVEQIIYARVFLSYRISCRESQVLMEFGGGMCKFFSNTTNFQIWAPHFQLFPAYGFSIWQWSNQDINFKVLREIIRCKTYSMHY